MAYEQPTYPEDDESLPREVRGKPIGYVDHNAPGFIPNPLDVGTVRTDGLGGQEGHHLDRYSPLFHRGSQDAIIKAGYETVPAVAHSVVDEELVHEDNVALTVSEESLQNSGESISNFAEELKADQPETDEFPVASEEVAPELFVDSDNATSE